MKRVATLALASLLTACGGSGSLCSHAETAWSDASKSAAQCGIQNFQFDRAACDANVAACNDQDQEAANAVLDCLEQLPDCDPGNPQAWSDAFNACGDPQMSTQTCHDAWVPSNG